MQPDQRKLALAYWASQQLSIPISSDQLAAITNDAGFRRYFRFADGRPLLAVDAPPATEDTRQFVLLASHLAQRGVRSPRILAADQEQGFLLVEDFGDQLIYRIINTANADHLYAIARETLLRLQACPDLPGVIPRYDQTLLRRELLLFNEWFVNGLLGFHTSADDEVMLNNLFEQLESSAQSQPHTLVHRDYHSRNLLLCNDEQLGVIDFQGALWGPITYDLVSLLRDCYLRWPAHRVRAWALDYHQAAIARGTLSNAVSEAEFLRWFDWMGLQRHIKVLGIFARLYLRDGKSGYLSDLPLVIRYCLEVSRHYPALHLFAEWFEAKLLPLAKQQNWYSDIATAGDQREVKGL